MLNANERSNGVERRCFCANDDIICKTFVTHNVKHFEAESLSILLTICYSLLYTYNWIYLENYL
jgi:hypothetical protein